MPRPREFDEPIVLDAAMRCFWARGYEATSMRDLAGEMGITGASLYNAFGDKRALYLRTLEQYVERGVRDRVARLAPLPPCVAIRAFFDEVVERSVTDPERRGCMLVNAALELGPDDTHLRARLADEMILIEDFFRRCVASGQDDGSITRDVPADQLAKLLLSVLFGIRVLARTRPQRAVLASAANAALSLLKSPN